MNLGQLIDRLAELPANLPIRRSDGKTPFRLMSWRGVYAELTLTSLYGDPEVAAKQLANLGLKDITVGELLREARAADGNTFTGYKGGEFRMDRDTTVWADEWGNCDHWCIVGIEEQDGHVVMKVLNRDDEMERLGLSEYASW